MRILNSKLKDDVLHSVLSIVEKRRSEIILENKRDLEAWKGSDQAMYDRLIVNERKVDDMLRAVRDIIADEDPVGKRLYDYIHPNGIRIENRTAPFGVVMIIYESRPDVTIEAAMVAFKSNNRILLKGGKEAIHTNKILVDCWHQALDLHGLSQDWITLLEFDRHQTQQFLKQPDQSLDLIVPRGGESLIQFVRQHANCPVLISGRGNNFLYVHHDADWNMALSVIHNAKTDKISACNALDKVLLSRQLPDLDKKLNQLYQHLSQSNVEVLVDHRFDSEIGKNDLSKEWEKEYLALKIAIGKVEGLEKAIEIINKYSGGHSVSIITENREVARQFMDEIDAASVFHNASTRFTDGGQFGLGAELAISTDKLHHRGPLGLHELVTNKWYVFGEGQVR